MSIGSKEEDDAVLKHYVFDDLSLTDIFWVGLRRKQDANGESFQNDYEWVDGSLNEYKRFAGNAFLRVILIFFIDIPPKYTDIIKQVD